MIPIFDTSVSIAPSWKTILTFGSVTTTRISPLFALHAFVTRGKSTQTGGVKERHPTQVDDDARMFRLGQGREDIAQSAGGSRIHLAEHLDYLDISSRFPQRGST